LLGVALAIVDHHGALPASLLIVVELPEIGDNVLSRPGLSTCTLDQGVVGVGLAVFVADVTAQEHGGLLVSQDDRGPA